ncbi:hypothetical protein Tco_0568946 [Tanacetum coccineum]
MPPRRFKKKSVKRIVEKRVAKAIEEYEKTRADSNNTGGSGSANTGGTVAPDVARMSYKTFMNQASTRSAGLKGSRTNVGLKRLLKCLRFSCVSTETKKIEKYIRGFPEGIKGNVTSSKPATLHDAINMAQELIEQGV